MKVIWVETLLVNEKRFIWNKSPWKSIALKAFLSPRPFFWRMWRFSSYKVLFHWVLWVMICMKNLRILKTEKVLWYIGYFMSNKSLEPFAWSIFGTKLTPNRHVEWWHDYCWRSNEAGGGREQNHRWEMLFNYSRHPIWGI